MAEPPNFTTSMRMSDKSEVSQDSGEPTTITEAGPAYQAASTFTHNEPRDQADDTKTNTLITKGAHIRPSLAPPNTHQRVQMYMSNRFQKPTAFAFFNVEGTLSNPPAEIKWPPMCSNGGENETIFQFAMDLHKETGIPYCKFIWVTPYGNNADMIRKGISELVRQGKTEFAGLRVTTVEESKGYKAKIALLGMTYTHGIGGMVDEALQDKALSPRGAYGLFVFQNWTVVQGHIPRAFGHNWAESVQSCKKRGCYFTLSAVCDKDS